jgi:hypothetical protein
MIPGSIVSLLGGMRLTLNQIEAPCLSCLVSPSLLTRRPQRSVDSASGGGSCLVSSGLCLPGSRESALVKALQGVSCLVSLVTPISPKRPSSSHAIASHRDSALENTPDSSHTRHAAKDASGPSYRNFSGRSFAFVPLGGWE